MTASALLSSRCSRPTPPRRLRRPGRLQGMLDFEAALARAEARAGVIPGRGRAPIAAQCRAELFDVDAARARHARSAGNPAIPMVKGLTALVAEGDPRPPALRPLGCDEPGRDGHRARAAAARVPRADRSAISRGSRPRSPRLAEEHRAHADGRPDLAAAGAADHLRAQGRGLARARWSATAQRIGRAPAAPARPPARRGGRHAGLAGRRRARGR